MDEPKFIIVAGASAGGLTALTQLIAGLPPQLPAAMFIVLHLSKHSSAEIIRYQLEKAGVNPCKIPEDGEAIMAGTIYLAPADQHLLIKKGTIMLTRGPHENRYRPSIDALFRSAAANYDSCVVGIVLSGMLDDGTAGMSAIKRSGGVCIVQEPADAAFADMPGNVLNQVDVDYRVPVADMSYILSDLFARPSRPAVTIPEDIILEAAITERMTSDITELQKLGTHSNYTCPDCGGGLWLMDKETKPRYRCHTGHVYAEGTLAEKQNEALEESLWVSIRMLEERRNLLLSMATRTEPENELSKQQHSRAEELTVHISRLKELLVALSKDKTPPDEGYL